MATIEVKTPEGVKEVIIQGDEPNAAETQAIINTFFSNKNIVEDENPYAGLTFDEAREKFKKGTVKDAESKEQIKATNEGEVSDHSFQAFYGRADNDSDREKRLTSEFGPDSFIRRGYDDYLLKLDNISSNKKLEYGLPETGTISVNKKGFGLLDVSRFLGGEAAPLLAATGAGLMASGVGIVPGAIIAAGAGMLGKAFDELLIEEKIEKLNAQGDDEVYKDIALTGMLYGAGEVIGRGIFAIARRFLKGPGPEPDPSRVLQLMEQNPNMSESKATIIAREERKKELRTAVDSGARPTVEEVSGKAITNRLQAIYEGIFPNRKAAELNRRYIEKQFKRFQNGDITEASLKESLEKQAQTIRNEVNIAMKNADVDEASKIAKQHLEKVIQNEFELIKSLYNPKAGLDIEFQLLLNNAARLFEHDSQILYKKASEKLTNAVDKDGGNASIFDTSLLKQTVQSIESDKAAQMALKDSAFSSRLLPYIKNTDNMTLDQLTSLKSAIRYSAKDPSLSPNMIDKQVGQMVRAIDDTIENKIKSLANYRDSLKVPNVKKEQADFFPNLEEALYAYNKAKNFYSNGIKRFDKLAIDVLEKDIKNGMAIGPKEIYKAIIDDKNPKKLNAFLKAITPSGRTAVYFQKSGAVNAEIFENAAKLAREGNIREAQKILKDAKVPDDLIPDVPDFATGFKANDPYLQHIGANFANSMDDYARFASSRANPAEIRNSFRDSIAREWITQNTKVKPSSIDDVADVFDASSFATSFDELGIPMQEALFGKVNAATMRNLTRDFYIMGKSGKELSEQVSKAFLEPQFSRPISASISGASAQAKAQTQRIRSEAELLAGEVPANLVPIMGSKAPNSVANSLANLKRVFELQKAQSDDALFRSIRNGSLDSPEELVTSVLTNPKNYRRLVGEFGEESLDAPANIKDAVMTRIISAAFPDGATSDVIASGAWGKSMRLSIEKLNRNKALDTILTEKTVKDLVQLSRLGESISSQRLAGKGGLAAATFAAAAGLRLLTAPASFIGEAAVIFGLGRIFRQKWFLKSLLNPRFETPSGITSVGGRRLYQEAIEAGADIDKNNVVKMELIERANQSFRLVAAALAGRGGEQASEVIKEKVINPVTKEAKPIVEDVTTTIKEIPLPNTNPQASMLQAPRTMAPNLTASEVLASVERDKLLGIT